ncbi:hypothetical protein [Chitinophaga rhizosphaerae]|uniref:hypothetical protein n=1 Tax=Chitinophaga rhizosphaerae TaxID=1864947 RepID=UPI000F80EA92|nr:hypothetical protein [Chitinophaga rhizosphaerae]
MRALFLLLLPALASAQVPTPEYLRLIRTDSLAQRLSLPEWRRLVITPGNLIRRVHETDTSVEIVRFKSARLYLRGNYVLGAGFQRAGQLPALQSAWAQGRASNGSLQWKGAETGEIFSYGPALSSLEYDGLSYPYDPRGRLVPSGTGNGRPAAAYRNSIFRTGHSTSHQLTLEGRVAQFDGPSAGLRVEAEQQQEALPLLSNRNRREKFAASLLFSRKAWELDAGYAYSATKFSNPNGNGFLQYAYAQSLLAPPSFDLRNGTGNMAFGTEKDNPFFLLNNNGQFARTRNRSGKFSAQYKTDRFRILAEPSLRTAEDDINYQFKPGSGIYPNGYTLRRSQQDRLWQLRSAADYRIFKEGAWKLFGHADYVFNDDQTAIGLLGNDPGMRYGYQRSSHRLTLSTKLEVDGNDVDGGLFAGVTAYRSNTLSKPASLLPWFKVDGRWDPDGVSFTGSLSYRKDATELRLDESLATANFLNIESYFSAGSMPRAEVQTFDGQPAIRHSEWSARLEAVIEQHFTIGVSLFRRQAEGDVVALPAGDRLELRQIGDHIREGLDVELSYRHEQFVYSSAGMHFRHSLLFSTWQHLVTKAYAGNDYLPVAGFRDVFKIFAEGYPMDAIAGTYWMRDGQNRLIIGPDGFPLRGPGTRKIANAKPDFVMSLTNGVEWRFLKLEATLEWQKGGEVWNGTAAALDYYGRSETSGQLRNVRDYVFPGVDLAGHPNEKPVRFYDPSQPVERNRWVRYGPGGVAEDYIEPNDWLNLRRIALNYDIFRYGKPGKIMLSVFAENLFLWQAYSGAAPGQELYGQAGFSGIDYFRLPSSRRYGASLHLQF